MRLVLFDFTADIPQPSIDLLPTDRSLVVTVTKRPGRYAVKEYCMLISGVNQRPICKQEPDSTVRGQFTASTVFFDLNSSTNYTVQGWIIVEINISRTNAKKIVAIPTSSTKATQTVQTLKRSKYIQVLDYIKACVVVTVSEFFQNYNVWSCHVSVTDNFSLS